MCKTIQDPVLRSPFDLTCEPSTELLQSYFEYVRAVRKKGYSYPVNLDDVWPICYSRKDIAVRELKEHFYEDIDYIIVKDAQTAQSADNQFFHKNAENDVDFPQNCVKIENQQVSDENEGSSSAGRKPVTYYLSLSGLEHLIVRRRREVFEVYRKVFHAALDYAEQQARQQATEIRNAPVEQRPDGRRIFLDYRLFSHRFYLMQSTADFEMHSYCKELIGRTQEGYMMPVDADEIYTLIGFKSAAQLTTFMNGGNPKKPSPTAEYKVGDDFLCRSYVEPGRYSPTAHRMITVGAFGRLLQSSSVPERFYHIFRQYFPHDNMRFDEINALYPIGLTLSQLTSDPATRIAQLTAMSVAAPAPSASAQSAAPAQTRTAEPSTAPVAGVSFTRLFQNIMSLRGKVSDAQILEGLSDLQRLASL